MGSMTSNSPDDMRASVSSIYADILNKRRMREEEKRERKKAEKAEKKERKEQKIAEGEEEAVEKLSKKERRERNLENWREVIIGLTGDDLDYSDEKKGKKKYRKWIDDDSSNQNQVMDSKPKKQKKKNYAKEFEPELNMLKALVADQNRFTTDILKRFQNAMGPATKDAMPPNKTMVDMIATINASRKNSLDMLNAIGSVKKSIAELYMKQKKLDADLGGVNGNVTDLGLMGSNIASSIFGDNTQTSWQSVTHTIPPLGSEPSTTVTSSSEPIIATSSVAGVASGPDVIQGEAFDPDTWDGGPDLSNSSVAYEAIPHHVVLEIYSDNRARFKAVRDDNGEELVGAPVPTSDPSKLYIDREGKRAKGQFDEIYPIEIMD